MLFYFIFLAYYVTGVTLGAVEYFRGPRDDRSVSDAGVSANAILSNGLWWPIDLVLGLLERRRARRTDA